MMFDLTFSVYEFHAAPYFLLFLWLIWCVLTTSMRVVITGR